MTQGDRTLLVALASFHANPDEPELADATAGRPAAARAAAAAGLGRATCRPSSRGTARAGSTTRRRSTCASARRPTFLGGPSGRRHPFALDAPAARRRRRRPAAHRAARLRQRLLPARHGVPRRTRSGSPPGGFAAFSVDHALWFHRPVRFDRWHLHTQETLAVSGHRGLVRGAIHDADGQLVASVDAGGAASDRYYGDRGDDRRSPTRYFEQPWPEGEYRMFQIGLVVDDVLHAAASGRACSASDRSTCSRASRPRAGTAATDTAVDMQIAVAQAGPVQIELIQQHCDRPSVYRELGRRRVADPPALRDHVRLRRQEGVRTRRSATRWCPRCSCAASTSASSTPSPTSASTPSWPRTSPASSRGSPGSSRTCAEWDGTTDPVRILTKDGYRTP